MRTLRLLLLVLISVACWAETDENPFPMRWRVYCDTRSADSFRYPYELFPDDQYKCDLRRMGAMMRMVKRSVTTTDTDASTPLTDKEIAEQFMPADRPEVHHFAYLPEDMSKAGLTTLQSVGDKEAGDSLQWSPYDYYKADPARPFADPRWADEGIEAMLGEGKDVCALVVRHGEHVSGLVLTGKADSAQNQRIIASFEVISCGHKLKKGDKLPRRPHWTNWAAAHCNGKVFDATGKLAYPTSHAQPTDWRNAWEIQTEHYHVTTDFNPYRLLGHGVYLEALFDAYSKLYRPETMPPYKFEVHIYSTYREFLDASADWGNPIPVGPGQIVGGFFQPKLLSLWVYEESGQRGGESFSVEHVMAHECSHQFLHVVCNGSDHIPTWINEGLAVYFEAGVFQGGQFVLRRPVERIQRLQQMYEMTGTTLWPLDKYINHHSFISADMYGEVYAMTMFWVFATCEPDFQHCPHKHCGYARFLEFMKALRNHEDGNKAFERIFMVDMIKQYGSREAAVAEWQKDLLLFVKSNLKG